MAQESVQPISKMIHFDAPNVGALEKEYAAKAIDSGFISTFGPFVGEFEQTVAKYVGAPSAVATQSGTAALYMALYELGVKAGDEVIVPAITFVATVNPVIYLGATPVFVDVDEETWNMDPKDLERAVTKKTKAVIPVHIYGNPCDMDAIMSIAKKHNLYVIEDATESLGATYKDRAMGTFGDFGCLSFNGNKVITTGGGGMLLGTDVGRLKHIKYLINQAKSEYIEEVHQEIGFNYRMTNIEGAIGIAQMKRVGEFLKLKRRFSEIYHEGLEGVSSITIQKEYPNARSSWWATCLRFSDGRDVEPLRQRLAALNVPVKRILKPVPDYPPYATYSMRPCEVAGKIYHSSLVLPNSTLNAEEDIGHVCAVIKECVRHG